MTSFRSHLTNCSVTVVDCDSSAKFQHLDDGGLIRGSSISPMERERELSDCITTDERVQGSSQSVQCPFLESNKFEIDFIDPNDGCRSLIIISWKYLEMKLFTFSTHSNSTLSRHSVRTRAIFPDKNFGNIISKQTIEKVRRALH